MMTYCGLEGKKQMEVATTYSGLSMILEQKTTIFDLCFWGEI